MLTSLAALEKLTGVHRSSIRRGLAERGVEAVRITSGRNGAVYYRTAEASAWLKSLGLQTDPNQDRGAGNG